MTIKHNKISNIYVRICEIISNWCCHTALIELSPETELTE